MEANPPPLVNLLISALAAVLCALCVGACSIVSAPVSAAVEAKLLRSQMGPEEFGAVRSAGGEKLKFKLFEGELDTRPVRVAMTKHFRGLPGMDVRLNNRHTISMLADTGAQACIMDARAVLAGQGRVFVPEKTSFTVTGIGGNETAWLARFNQVDFGSLQLKSFTTLVRRHKTVSQFAGVGYGNLPINLIGCPVFLGFAYVTFDYPASEFVFSAGTPFVPPADARPIPIRIHEQLIYVPLRIRGHEIEAVVDTGAKDQIFLSTRTIQKLGLQSSAERGGTYRAVGLGGETSGRQFTLPLTFLGSVPLRDITVDTAESDAWSARIGTELLERWRVTFDFGRNVMWIEPARR